MTDARERRSAQRAANVAAAAELKLAYSRLPAATRAEILIQYKAEKARNSVIRWQRYLEVVLPRLPADAR